MSPQRAKKLGKGTKITYLCHLFLVANDEPTELGTTREDDLGATEEMTLALPGEIEQLLAGGKVEVVADRSEVVARVRGMLEHRQLVDVHASTFAGNVV
ncbi:hypothetical protein Drorol1_Dr00018041 [Drosera rotundifolia]